MPHLSHVFRFNPNNSTQITQIRQMTADYLDLKICVNPSNLCYLCANYYPYNESNSE